MNFFQVGLVLDTILAQPPAITLVKINNMPEA
jgi:hypothetical protein